MKPKQRKGRATPGRGRSGKSQITADTELAIARAVLDEGKSLEEVAREHGLRSDMVARFAVAREQGRREAQPNVTPEMLSMSAQKKFDAAIRAYKSKLDAEFSDRVNARVREFLEETILPLHRKEQAQALQVIHARKGIMDKASFRLIWSALHPDSRKSISDRKLAEAFDVFSRLEKLLLDEKQSQTSFQKLPSSMADWDRMRAAATAERRAKQRMNNAPRPR